VQSDDGPCRHFGQNVFSFREFPLSSKGCFTFLLIPDSWISRFPDSRLSARVKAAVAAVREKWGFEAAGRDAASPRMCKMFSYVKYYIHSHQGWIAARSEYWTTLEIWNIFASYVFASLRPIKVHPVLTHPRTRSASSFVIPGRMMPCFHWLLFCLFAGAQRLTVGRSVGLALRARARAALRAALGGWRWLEVGVGLRLIL